MDIQIIAFLFVAMLLTALAAYSAAVTHMRFNAIKISYRTIILMNDDKDNIISDIGDLTTAIYHFLAQTHIDNSGSLPVRYHLQIHDMHKHVQQIITDLRKVKQYDN